VTVPAGKTLSRDYKHVKRHTPGGSDFGGWLGFAAGLGVGLAVAFGVHLHYRNLEPPVPEPAADAPPASAQAPEVPAAVAESEEAPRYDFYDILPSQELEVPESALQKNTVRATLAEGSITLQAGAFKQVAEAEKLQAKLAQYGVDAKIQRLSLEDETYYRVRIGPIATVEELESVRAKLAEAEIEATPVTAAMIEPPP
jgi:cell division protein FtsN